MQMNGDAQYLLCSDQFFLFDEGIGPKLATVNIGARGRAVLVAGDDVAVTGDIYYCLWKHMNLFTSGQNPRLSG
jgi:hypothetical protein